MMSHPVICEYCRFYSDHQCHRYPPQIFVDNDGSGVAFPVVGKNDWCGEWKRKGAITFPEKDDDENQD